MEKSLGGAGHPPSPSLFSEPARPVAPRLGIPYGGSLLRGRTERLLKGSPLTPRGIPYPSLSLPASLNGTGNGRPTRFLA